MPVIAVDTSVAVTMLVASHSRHAMVAQWAKGRKIGLCGHALAEKYSVLTRRPASTERSWSPGMRVHDRPTKHSAWTPASPQGRSFSRFDYEELIGELIEAGHGDPLRWSAARIENALSGIREY